MPSEDNKINSEKLFLIHSTSFAGGHECPETDLACVLLHLRRLPTANQRQHVPHGGREPVLRTRYDRNIKISSLQEMHAHKFTFSPWTVQTTTTCSGPPATAATSPSRPGTSSWRPWDSPGTTPALCVRYVQEPNVTHSNGNSKRSNLKKGR